MNQDPEREWAECHTEAMLRAQAAVDRVRADSDYADNVLAQLNLIRDRLITMQAKAAALAAGFRTE